MMVMMMVQVTTTILLLGILGGCSSITAVADDPSSSITTTTTTTTGHQQEFVRKRLRTSYAQEVADGADAAEMAIYKYDFMTNHDFVNQEDHDDNENEETKKTTTTKPTVGVYYYPWYTNANHFHGRSYLRQKLVPISQRPVLHEYDSQNHTVIHQHLNWCQDAGINLWVSSWWGPESTEDYGLKHDIVPVIEQQQQQHQQQQKQDQDDGGSNMKFAIHYETLNRLHMKFNTHGHQSSVDLSNIVSDFTYLAQKYFDHPSYYRMDNKPVVFLYVTRVLNKSTLGELVSLIRSTMKKVGSSGSGEIYLVGDEAFGSLMDHGPNMIAKATEAVVVLDAITNYDVYGSIMQAKDNAEAVMKMKGDNDDDWTTTDGGDGDEWSSSINDVYSGDGGGIISSGLLEEEQRSLTTSNNDIINHHHHSQHHYAGNDGVQSYLTSQSSWKRLANTLGCHFIPAVSPGFNDRGTRLDVNHTSLSRRLSPKDEFGTLFQSLLVGALKQVDGGVGGNGLVMINSWNEWHEDSQIEPVEWTSTTTTTSYHEYDGRTTRGNTTYTQNVEYEAYGTRYLDLLKKTLEDSMEA